MPLFTLVRGRSSPAVLAALDRVSAVIVGCAGWPPFRPFPTRLARARDRHMFKRSGVGSGRGLAAAARLSM
jgi:hypothetical protein